jgi:uncharacterized protein (TIGR03437 family)
MYYSHGSYVQFEYLDWGPADGVHNNQIVANVSDDLTFNNIYLYDLVFSQLGAPALNSVVNGGSFTPVFASGEWVTIFGENLAPESREWATSDFVGNNLPTSLDRVSVSIDGIPAYVEYVSPDQINVLAPDDPMLGMVNVQVTNGGVSSQSVLVNKQEFVPAFFMFPGDGSKYIVATHGNNNPIGTTSPAQPGEEIVLWGTGFGSTNPPAASGQLIAAPVELAKTLTVTVGGVPALVDFAGLVAPGLDQINVVIPAGLPAGDQLVMASVGEMQTQADAYIAVQ